MVSSFLQINEYLHIWISIEREKKLDAMVFPLPTESFHSKENFLESFFFLSFRGNLIQKAINHFSAEVCWMTDICSWVLKRKVQVAQENSRDYVQTCGLMVFVAFGFDLERSIRRKSSPQLRATASMTFPFASIHSFSWFFHS